MGVPKFYRWLSERYPCLSQVIEDYQIPEFDNLYLDMNGIIHPCSHPNDDDPHFRITEEQIFLNIFHYIEVLFRIIKPQKVFFMAVDGVAPRAKMNQQRSRRFRSAREAEENIRKALQKGEVLPTEERFDSNCITPGTEFMVRLHEQLKYFINKKITTDPGWRDIKIYLSGHETPGEGEHKIMDYIRYERSQPGYNSNTRHCLYGLDADLIMLGLTSHDPHFSLLREEIRFGKKVKRISNPENITFHLLHLSLLREYIEWEFISIKDKISFGYDVEKIIDDWILMGFLVGNDFVPNLPNFHINHDALPYLWKVYKDVMPTFDGYLHDGGFLNLARFETYLKHLAKFDLDKFKDAHVDLKWLEGKMAKEIDDQEDPFSLFEKDEVDSAGDQLDKIKLGSPKKGKLREYLHEKGVLAEAMQEDDGDFSEEHEKFKLKYYYEKFELKDVDSCLEFVRNLTLKYVEAIQWILHYYFNGISSWGWYFPYHYAPYVSDIVNFKDVPLKFNIGKAFLPYEQLLAVLPAASKKLLPEPFQNLMIMEQSPIIDYYPLEFKTDLNGKKQDWEAVVLIPFIDEERLIDAMKPLLVCLNKQEKTRNRHSPCLLYTYDKNKTEKYTSLSKSFPDIECCHASCEIIPIDQYRLAPTQIVKGILPDVKLDVYFPGFPTLKHIPHTGELKMCNVKVFQMHSRHESMVLSIDEKDEQDIKKIANEMLGKPCFVGWPHLIEAFVTSVSDGKKKFLVAKESQEKVHELTMTAKDVSAWKKQASSEKQYFHERKAIETGIVHVVVEACQIIGKKFICGAKGSVSCEKVWSETPRAYPLQVTIKDLNVCDETDAPSTCSNIIDLFSVDTEVFMKAVPHYGSSGKVIEVDEKQNRVRVQLTVIPEPDLIDLIINQDDHSVNYIPSHIMSKRLGISNQILSQITGKVFLVRGNKDTSSRIDIGLNLKFSKQDKEVLGYARRFSGQWTYSNKTEELITAYQEKFPEVFDMLSNEFVDVRKVSEVFPDDDTSNKLSQLEKWLKSLPSHKQKAVKCGSLTLDEPVIKQIEETVQTLKNEMKKKKNVTMRVIPTVLYRPMGNMGQVPPDETADFELFDRVVNVRTLGVAPYGLRGTIVGIHQVTGEHNVADYEVLFDEPFMGGQSLRGSFENKLFLVQAWSLLNLTYGTRIELKKQGLLSPQKKYQQEHQERSDNHSGGWSVVSHRATGKGSRHPSPQGNVSSPNNRFSTPPERYSSPRGRFPTPRDQFSTPRGKFPNSRGRNSNSREQFQSPRGQFQSPRGQFQSPRGQFQSPRGQFQSPRGQFQSPRGQLPSPRGQSPRGRGSPRGQPSPHTPNQPKILKKTENLNVASNLSKPRTAASNSPDASAKECERVIRQLLNLDGASSPSPLPITAAPAPVPVVAGTIPSLSPTSPGSYAPSGILTMICQQKGYPPPDFSHHTVQQGGYITTVCVVGKLYQGALSPNIVESTESAANVALMNSGLLPPLPISFPPPSNQPSSNQPRSPRHNYQSSRPAPHHRSSPTMRDGKEKKGQTRNISDERKSGETKKQTTSKQSKVGAKNPFIPHQVLLKETVVDNKTEVKGETLNEKSIEKEKMKIEPEVTSQKIIPPPHNNATATIEGKSPIPQPEKPAEMSAAEATDKKPNEIGKPSLLAPSFFSGSTTKTE